MSPGKPPARTAINLHAASPILRVRDLGASLAYYETKLGFATDWVDQHMIASVSRGACMLMLCQGDQGYAGTWAFIGVGDAAALHQEFVKHGAIVRHPPTNYYWALEMQVSDPDGNVLRFASARVSDT